MAYTKEQRRQYTKEWRLRNPRYSAEQSRRYKAENPGRYGRQQFYCTMRQKYGLGPEQYDELVIAQGGRCAACSCELTKPHVDHCHDTGQVRAILCHGCNTALGHLKDSPMRVSALLEYIGDQSCV